MKKTLITELKNTEGIKIIHFINKNSDEKIYDKKIIKNVDKIKKKIIKKFKCEQKNIRINEYFFNDLKKIEIFDLKTHKTYTTYEHVNQLFKIIDDILIITNNNEKIEENNFPNLNEYNHMTTKYIDIFDIDWCEIKLTKQSVDIENAYLSIEINKYTDDYKDDLTFILSKLI